MQSDAPAQKPYPRAKTFSVHNQPSTLNYLARRSASKAAQLTIKWRSFTAMLAVVCILLNASANAAITLYWGGSGNWTGANTWSSTQGGTLNQMWANGDIAEFDVANSTVTFASATVSGITANQNVTLTAGGTLSTGGTVMPITVASGMTLNLAAQSISTGMGTGLSKSGAGSLYSANGNAYPGGFTLTAGSMIVGGVNAMGNGGALNINGGAIGVSGTETITTRYTGINIGGDFQLGVLSSAVSLASSTAALTFADNVALGAATRTITIGANGTYTLGGVISGSPGSGLTINLLSGATGNITLTGANSYTGDTTIIGGTLALSGSGSIANAPNIVVAGGATFDVSGLTTALTLASGQAIKASGTTTSGTIATIASKGTTMAANSPLQFTAFNGSTAPLTVTGASSLTLAGNPVTVTIASGGTALGSGNYKLIAKGAGNTTAVNGTLPSSVTVNGNGITAGSTASLVISGGELFLSVVTTYYSTGSTDPAVTTSWNSKSDGTGVNPANFNSGVNDTFMIQNGHNMATTTPWTVGSGTIEIENGGTLTANNLVTVPNFQVDNGGTYTHNNGSAGSSNNGLATDIPGTTRTFGPTSSVEIQKWANGGSSPVALPIVSWGNLKINVATLGGGWQQGGGLTTVQGNLTIVATGGQVLRLATSQSPTLNIGGDLIVQGGIVEMATTTGSPTINVSGNLSVTGGTLDMENGGTSGTSTLNVSGNVTVSSGTLKKTTAAATGNIVFNKSGTQTFTSGGTISGVINWTVNNGSTVDFGTSVLAAADTGTFTVSSGAGIKIGSTAGIATSGATGNIQVTGTRTFSTGGNYTYNGSAAQAVGNGLPATVNNLTIANTGSSGNNIVTLAQNSAVNGTLSITSGTLDLNGKTVTAANAPSLSGGLQMEIVNGGGAANSLALTSGTLTYGGTFIVTSSGGGTMANGNSFTLFTAPSFSSWFSSVTLPTLASGLNWDTNMLATNGLLQVYSFTTTPLAFSTRTNQSATLVNGLLLNHAVSSRGTVIVSAVSTPAHGTTVLNNSDGSVTYTPANSFAGGSDSFTITFQDGHGLPQTIAVSATVNGGSGGQSANVLASGTTNIGGMNYFYANFAGVPGQVYTVETNSVMSGPGWVKEGNNYTAPTTNQGFGIGVFQVLDPMGTGNLYYRAVWPAY